MNTDERISAILRAEADTVEPSAAGWDAITRGIAVRRRRTWWLRSSALAATAAAVVAVGAYVTHDGTHTLRQPPVTSQSPAPEPDDTPTGAVWPFQTMGEVRAWDRARETAFETPEGAVIAFAKIYLGFAAQVGTGEGGRYDVTRRIGDQTHLVTRAVVAGFGPGGGAPYVVLRAESPSLDIAAPAPTAGSLAAHGTYRLVDPAIDVTLYAGSTVVARQRATTGPPDGWDATLAYPGTARTGSLLVTNGSLADSGLDTAAAVPVTFTSPVAGSS